MNDDDDDDVSLTPLFHACTGRTVAPLQLPDSQSFQPHQHFRFQVLTRLADPGMVMK